MIACPKDVTADDCCTAVTAERRRYAHHTSRSMRRLRVRALRQADVISVMIPNVGNLTMMMQFPTRPLYD